MKVINQSGGCDLGKKCSPSTVLVPNKVAAPPMKFPAYKRGVLTFKFIFIQSAL